MIQEIDASRRNQILSPVYFTCMISSPSCSDFQSLPISFLSLMQMSPLCLHLFLRFRSRQFNRIEQIKGRMQNDMRIGMGEKRQADHFEKAT